MSTGPKKIENRGGTRQGAGRKRSTESFSAEKIQELNDRIDTYAKEEGKHIDDIALGIIYDESQHVSARMKAYDTIKKYSSIQAKEGGEADQSLAGPQIGLPEKRPDPAKVVDIKKKKK